MIKFLSNYLFSKFRLKDPPNIIYLYINNNKIKLYLILLII